MHVTVFQAAVVYEALAVVKYGAGMAHAQVVKLEGIGKYPHILVSSSGATKQQQSTSGDIETIVSFGKVSVRQTAEKWVELHNLSPVSADAYIYIGFILIMLTSFSLLAVAVSNIEMFSIFR